MQNDTTLANESLKLRGSPLGRSRSQLPRGYLGTPCKDACTQKICRERAAQPPSLLASSTSVFYCVRHWLRFSYLQTPVECKTLLSSEYLLDDRLLCCDLVSKVLQVVHDLSRRRPCLFQQAQAAGTTNKEMLGSVKFPQAAQPE